MKNRFLYLIILIALVLGLWVILRGCGTPERKAPVDNIIPGEKTSLRFVAEPPFSVLTVIGFTFSNGQTAIKAAPVKSISTDPIGFTIAGSQVGFTRVGVVEIGSGSADIIPGPYEVLIDLGIPEDKADGQVSGLLIPIPLEEGSTTYEQHFNRALHQVNSAREPSTLPDPGVSILSNSVCFIVGLGDPKDYFQYCSVVEPYLSVSNQFPENYESIQNEIVEAAEALGFQGILVLDLTIGALEDGSHIESCNSNSEDCGADIVGAPVSTFYDDYDVAKSEAAGENFAVTAAIVRVHRELNIDEILIKPGKYQVEYWFKPDDTFLGATLYGKTDEGEDVIDQQIHAGEPAYISVGKPKPIMSEISAWKLMKKCLIRQQSCP